MVRLVMIMDLIARVAVPEGAFVVEVDIRPM